ncbi:MAG TPA: PPOX class F420-dependent oxidoreductase [Aggregatilineales bacterium]|nr:PPOX class F420-dependent oxidoreductase [Aggregatilineales bacterium]
MVALIPETHQDLLDRPIYVVATTVMPDGQPQSTVVWWDYEGDFIRFNTADGRQKPKNIRQNPKITLLALDPNNPFHWLEIRGVVEEMTTEGGVEHIESLSRKYTGRAYYSDFNTRSSPDTETRLVVKVRPIKVTAL